MRYAGEYTGGQIPSNALHTEFVREEIHGSKTVQYFDVWVTAEGFLSPDFPEDKDPATPHYRKKIEGLHNLLSDQRDIQPLTDDEMRALYY